MYGHYLSFSPVVVLPPGVSVHLLICLLKGQWEHGLRARLCSVGIQQ